MQFPSLRYALAELHHQESCSAIKQVKEYVIWLSQDGAAKCLLLKKIFYLMQLSVLGCPKLFWHAKL